MYQQHRGGAGPLGGQGYANGWTVEGKQMVPTASYLVLSSALWGLWFIYEESEVNEVTCLG